MRIDIEHVKELKSQLDEINRYSLHTIELYENGEKIEPDTYRLSALEESSISNVHIILGRFFEKR